MNSAKQSKMKCKIVWGKCIDVEALSFDILYILARAPEDELVSCDAKKE